jgi:hypothetical protein
MRRLGIALFASLIACSASAVWAQGLYGSPDVLPVQQQYVPGGSAAPAQSPAQPGYQPYGYPAQAPAAATYQPHQPGAQYQYPTPAAQPVAWTAPSEQPALVQPGPVSANAPIPEPVAVPPQQVYAPPQTFAPPQQGFVPPPQNTSVMSQMMAEQGNGCAGGCNANTNCGQDAALCTQACCPWYFSLSTIVVGRSDSRRLWTSHVDGDETTQLTNTDFGLQWKWGGEVRFGRRFCCDCVPYAIEAVYWTADPFTGYRSTTVDGGFVSTPLDLNSMTFGGVDARNWFDGAQEHRLWRRDEFHDIEINLIREQLAWGCDSCWDIGWSLGVRYFRFQDYLQFGSEARFAASWDDLPNTAYLNDRITNNLIGPQVGFDAAYRLCDSLRLFISPKVGIFDNYLDSTFEATTGNGIAAHGPYGDFPVHGTRNALSFLTQIDVGADWRIARNWSARAGYRVVAITGVGLADDQFTQYINDIPEIARVANTSSLVLHGAFLGVTYNF